MRRHNVVVPEGITIKRDGNLYVCSNGEKTLYIRHNYRTDSFDLYEPNGIINGRFLSSRGYLRFAKEDAIALLQGKMISYGFNGKVSI